MTEVLPNPHMEPKAEVLPESFAKLDLMIKAFLKDIPFDERENYTLLGVDKVSETKGSKAYDFCLTQDLEKVILDLPECDRNYYEIEAYGDKIIQERKLKGDFDLEPKNGQKIFDEFDPDINIQILKLSIAEEFQESYERKISLDDILIFTGTTPQKHSYHWVVDKYKVKDHFQAKEFLLRLKHRLTSIKACSWAEFLDESPYGANQNFRLGHCCKLGKTNHKKPFGDAPPHWFTRSLTTNVKYCRRLPDLDTETKPYKNNDEKYEVEDDLIYEIANCFEAKVGNRNGNLISLNNKHCPRICRINGERNDTDNAFLIVGKHTIKYGCNDTGCKGQFIIAHEFENDEKEDSEQEDEYDQLTAQEMGGKRISSSKGDPRKSKAKGKSNKKKKIFDKGLFANDLASAQTAYNMMGKQIKITWVNGDNVYAYIWNDKTLLWEAHTMEKTQKHIFDLLLKKANSMINEIKDDDDMIECLEKAIKKMSSATGRKSIFQLCKELFQDLEFKHVIKTPTNSIAIAGGKVYNIQTGEKRLRTPHDFFYKEHSFDIVEITADAETYYKELFSDDWNRVNLILGYCWTTLTSAKRVFVGIGTNDTGKSSLFKIMSKMFGGRYKTLNDKAIFEHNSSSNHDEELAAGLNGSTLMVCSESVEGKRIKEKPIKDITGGDNLALRRCGEKIDDSKDEQPCRAKLIILTNNHPILPLDKTLTSKFDYIRFENQFSRSKENQEKMEKRMNDQNFLNQMFTLQMKAATEFYKNRTIPLDEEGQRKYLNPVDNWIEETCIVDEKCNYSAEDAFPNFSEWAKKADVSCKVNERQFKAQMRAKFGGTKQIQSNTERKRYYVGLRIKTKEELEKDEEKVEQTSGDKKQD